MPWTAIIPLIAQVGIPLAQKIWLLATTGKDATQADWDQLAAIEAETPMSHLASVAASLGLPMTDPKVVALAELIQ